MTAVAINGRTDEEIAIRQISAPVSVLQGLEIPEHDYIALTYDVNENLTGVTYKQGGASGSTVAALTLAYDVNGNLTSVTKA